MDYAEGTNVTDDRQRLGYRKMCSNRWHRMTASPNDTVYE